MATYESDKVIVELLAKTDDFDAKITQSAQTVDKATNTVIASTTKLETAVTRSAGKRSQAELAAARASERAATVEAARNNRSSVDASALADKIELYEQRKAAAIAVAEAIRGSSAAKDIATSKAVGAAHTIEAAEVVKAEAVKAAAVTASSLKSAAAAKTVQLLLTGPDNPLSSLASTAQPAASALDGVTGALEGVVEGISGGGGEGGAAGGSKLLAGLMGGLGGIVTSIAIPALLAGAEALFKLATSEGEADDAINALVDKMKEQAVQAGYNEAANKIWRDSIEGVREATAKLTKELEAQIQTGAQKDEAALATAQKDVSTTKERLRRAEIQLREAQKELKPLQDTAAIVAATSEGGNPALDKATARVEKLKQLVADLAADVAKQTNAVRLAAVPIAERAADGLADRQKGINNFFDRLKAETEQASLRSEGLSAALTGNIAAIERARAAFLKGGKEGASLNKGLDSIVTLTQGLNQGKLASDRFAGGVNTLAKTINTAADAAKKLADETTKAAKAGSGLSGKTIGFDEAKSIAQRAGFQVNSSQRTFAQQKALYDDPKVNRPGNPVARPGTSAHEGANGKFALDIQFAPGLTAGKIKKVFGDEGVSVKVFKEVGHFHAEGSTGQGRSTSPEVLARRQEAAAARLANIEEGKVRREQAADDQINRGNQELINLRQSLITSAEEIAKLEVASIELSRVNYRDKLDSQIKTGQLTKDEADELSKINDERAKLRTELVARREAQRAFAMREAAAQLVVEKQVGGIGAERELLQSREAVAKTQGERRDIERRLLELQFQEERIQNDALIAEAERLKIKGALTDAERAELDRANVKADLAREANASIPERQANATTSSDRSTAGPLESLFGPIKSDAADLNTAFESIAAGGLATFTDALTSAIVNFTSLKDVGRAVLQSITAALVKLAIQQLLNATIGKAIASASAAAQVAQLAAIGAAAAGPAALVATASFGAASVAANAGLASTAALAAIIGAPKAEGGRIEGTGTDTSDNILTPTSRDEFVIKASSARKIGFAQLERMNLTGSVPSMGAPRARGGRIGSGFVSPSNERAAGGGGGGGGFSEGDIASLRGIVSEAARAMPSVGLYASLDPVDVLQRALGSPAGEKSLIAALGRNSGRVKASIG